MQRRGQLIRAVRALIGWAVFGSLGCGQAPELKRTPTAPRAVEGVQAPCSQMASDAQLDELERRLNASRPPAHLRAGSGWRTLELNALMSERSALVWWWAITPKGGARTRPPEPPSALFDRLERCDQRWRWQARGEELWALTIVSARPRPPTSRRSHTLTEVSEPDRVPAPLTLIVACTPCTALEQREAVGSPLPLPDKLLVHIKTLVEAEGEARWLATRLRSPAQSLADLRSQTCLCR